MLLINCAVIVVFDTMFLRNHAIIYSVRTRLGLFPHPERTLALELQGEPCVFEYLI